MTTGCSFSGATRAVTNDAIAKAANLVRHADGLIVTAGAGMGVDSGLPDFRGEGGFWKHYPALGRAGLSFTSIASPNAFRSRLKLAWGFYGHRLRLYRETIPNEGFHILKRWAEGVKHGAFVVTSNVDGQFQKTGFNDDRIYEVHGSIHHLQCLDACRQDIWSADSFDPIVDEATCTLTSEPPRCPHCGGLARPHILMFGDWEWLDGRSRIQGAAVRQWRLKLASPVVIEIGAGTDIPTIRILGQQMDAPMIRINPKEPAVSNASDVPLPMGCVAALREIDALLAG